jgi:hypothetical protein
LFRYTYGGTTGLAIRPAALGNLASVIGAAAVVYRRISKK